MMHAHEIVEEVERCAQCNLCLDVCPVYEQTGEERFSPIGMLKAATETFGCGKISNETVENVYSCLECGRCDEACPLDIRINDLVHYSRVKLVQLGLAPPEKQRRVANGVMETGNSVMGDPGKRLDWIPKEYRSEERFENKGSDTLLWLGCLSSYRVKDSAVSSYLALKRVGADFMILEDEGCCGVFLYDAGMVNSARSIFEKDAAQFKELGVKRIITPCSGCYRCFKRYYPELLGDTDFEVLHVVEVLHELLKRGNLKLRKEKEELTYHDPCRTGRKEGEEALYEEPRGLLRECGIKVKEMKDNREMAPCCGAGSGVRSLHKELSLKMAESVLDSAPTRKIVTSCSFCVFNLRHAARKRGMNKEVVYITDVINERMKTNQPFI